MSATLYFVDKNNELVAPWKCQCVRRLSADAFEAQYGMMEECGCADLDCNMSNANARAVLNVLGLNNDFENNSFTPQELWGACKLFLDSDMASLPGIGRNTEVSGGNGGVLVINFGIDGNYLEMRVRQIWNMCNAAMLDGAMKCYFC
mgnify:CR=1 FL=1